MKSRKYEHIDDENFGWTGKPQTDIFDQRRVRKISLDKLADERINLSDGSKWQKQIDKQLEGEQYSQPTSNINAALDKHEVRREIVVLDEIARDTFTDNQLLVYFAYFKNHKKAIDIGKSIGKTKEQIDSIVRDIREKFRVRGYNT